MGKLFGLIADQALVQLDDYYAECHICSRTDVGLYQYQGNFYPGGGAPDEEVYAVCADCIHTKQLSHSCDFEYIQTIEKYLAASGMTDQERVAAVRLLTEKYQRTPDIPVFMQYEDRPLCCNDITEFTGHTADEDALYEMTEHNVYWEKEIKEKSELYDFRKFGVPESFRDIAAFRCRHCGTEYFTFQFT